MFICTYLLCHSTKRSCNVLVFRFQVLLYLWCYDMKRGGLCIYYKDYLPLARKYGMSTLNECFICELKIGKKYILLQLYIGHLL